MGRAIDQDNRLDNHQKRLEILEGVVAELSEALMNTKQTKSVDLHDALDEHERELRKTKTKRKAKKTVEVD